MDRMSKELSAARTMFEMIAGVRGIATDADIYRSLGALKRQIMTCTDRDERHRLYREIDGFITRKRAERKALRFDLWVAAIERAA